MIPMPAASIIVNRDRRLTPRPIGDSTTYDAYRRWDATPVHRYTMPVRPEVDVPSLPLESGDGSLAVGRYCRPSCHCALVNQNLRIQSILGRFCTPNCNTSTGPTLQDLTPLERLQIASARTGIA